MAILGILSEPGPVLEIVKYCENHISWFISIWYIITQLYWEWQLKVEVIKLVHERNAGREIRPSFSDLRVREWTYRRKAQREFRVEENWGE